VRKRHGFPSKGGTKERKGKLLGKKNTGGDEGGRGKEDSSGSHELFVGRGGIRTVCFVLGQYPKRVVSQDFCRSKGEQRRGEQTGVANRLPKLGRR